MGINIEINVEEFINDLEGVVYDLEQAERKVLRILQDSVEETMEELVEVISRYAPESEPGEYVTQVSDYPPNEELGNSFYATKSAEDGIAWTFDSTEGRRALILEKGDPKTRRVSAEHTTTYEDKHGNEINTLGKLAIPIEDSENADAIIDGNPYIFRESVKRGPIKARRYIRRAIDDYNPGEQLEKKIQRKLYEEFIK